jgi:Fe-S cluster biogenesis protein NfuA/nitrite reductase/ring-hydroxylating ferredoxin subunit
VTAVDDGAARADLDSEALVARVAELTERLDVVVDPIARETALDLVAAVMELHRVGLERLCGALDGDAPELVEARRTLTDDGVVASLLLIHGLYPVPLADRVAEALRKVRPYLASHGGDVELVGVADGVARLRLTGSCDGCAGSAATLELAIRQALDEEAPDLDGLEVEGAVPPPAPVTLGLSRWVPVDVGGLADGALAALEVNGAELVVARIDGGLLAYRDACAGCGGPLRAGALAGAVLTCPSCGARFDLPLAGRSLAGGPQLAAVPLLADAGAVRVAVR